MRNRQIPGLAVLLIPLCFVFLEAKASDEQDQGLREAAAAKKSQAGLGLYLLETSNPVLSPLKLPPSSGAFVNHVTRNSAAMAMGVKTYDLIVAIDGRSIKSVKDLLGSLSKMHPGEMVKVELVRDGKKVTVSGPLGERPTRPTY